jgi:general secretion pathway protein M
VFTTPLISRAAALLLLLTAIFAGYTFLVEPMIVGYGENDAQIEEARNQLARFERMAAMRPALTRQVNEFRAKEESLGYYLTGRTDALAAAALQDRVNTLVSDKGGTLSSVQPMPGVEDHGLTRVTLRVQMTGTTEALFDILYALESGAPLVFIDNLDIQSSQQASGGTDSTALPSADLTVAFDLSGYSPKESE